MNDNHHRHQHHHHHPSVRGQSQLVRPQYSQGLMLQDDDLTQAVDYARELSQLLFRSLLGGGVVYGLAVKLHFDGCKTTVSVAPGLALDTSGQPIQVPERQAIELGKHGDDLSRPRWIVIRRHEQPFMPRGLACNPEDDAHSSVYTRLHDGFEIGLVEAEAREGACGCALPGEGEDIETARQACFAPYLQGDAVGGVGSGWVVLGYFANIEQAKEQPEARKDGVSADHRVRRFIRPALLPDPLWGAPAAGNAAGASPAAPGGSPGVDPAKPKEAAGGAQAGSGAATGGADAGPAPEAPAGSAQ
jgi:hypothetical protein